MGTVPFTSIYKMIDVHIARIDEPNREPCRKLMSDNRPLFEKARGSTHNHQTWEGGYIDHIAEVMNLVLLLYPVLKGTGRRVSFSVSDALLVLFLHDLEKPWRIEVAADGTVSNRKGLDTKEAFKVFREAKLEEYGFDLTPSQMNALTYVEGELGGSYRSTERVMNELAAFCHMIDTWSARGWYDYPLAEGDEWDGAQRFRFVT